jgi:prepilin signal peptidase PulO-like enzyme (type II secretory pathway)
MNVAFVVTVCAVAVLCVIASFLGRKNQEWKQVLRIVVGIGLFVFVWRAVIFSNWDQWTKVGAIAFICLGLWLLNMVNALNRVGGEPNERCSGNTCSQCSKSANRYRFPD